MNLFLVLLINVMSTVSQTASLLNANVVYNVEAESGRIEAHLSLHISRFGANPAEGGRSELLGPVV